MIRSPVMMLAAMTAAMMPRGCAGVADVRVSREDRGREPPVRAAVNGETSTAAELVRLARRNARRRRR